MPTCWSQMEGPLSSPSRLVPYLLLQSHQVVREYVFSRRLMIFLRHHAAIFTPRVLSEEELMKTTEFAANRRDQLDFIASFLIFISCSRIMRDFAIIRKPDSVPGERVIPLDFMCSKRTSVGAEPVSIIFRKLDIF